MKHVYRKRQQFRITIEWKHEQCFKEYLMPTKKLWWHHNGKGSKNINTTASPIIIITLNIIKFYHHSNDNILSKNNNDLILFGVRLRFVDRFHRHAHTHRHRYSICIYRILLVLLGMTDFISIWAQWFMHRKVQLLTSVYFSWQKRLTLKTALWFLSRLDH